MGKYKNNLLQNSNPLESGNIISQIISSGYFDLEELLSIRGIKVNHSTMQRWVYKFTPMIEANMHRRKRQVSDSWKMDWI